jgi:hypothetical protein
MLKHAGEVAVGSGLVARLPAFPDAPVDELLDLRSDLAGPLTRYRRAASSMATRLTARPFDREAAAEMDDLWNTEVAPALADIEEGLEQHGLVREVGRALGQDVKSLLGGGAAIYVGFDQLTSLDSWISATAAAAAPGLTALVSGIQSSLTAKRDLRGRDLFYLYEVNRRLG